MKKFAAFSVIAGIVLAGAFVYLAVHIFANQYLSNRPKDAPAACTKTGTHHVVILHNDAASPAHTDAKLCDTLTITNTDDQIRLVAFGVHESHQTYDGVVERALQKGQSLTVKLNKTGAYRFHDHIEDQVQGTFTVKN